MNSLITQLAATAIDGPEELARPCLRMLESLARDARADAGSRARQTPAILAAGSAATDARTLAIARCVGDIVANTEYPARGGNKEGTGPRVTRGFLFAMGQDFRERARCAERPSVILVGDPLEHPDHPYQPVATSRSISDSALERATRAASAVHGAADGPPWPDQGLHGETPLIDLHGAVLLSRAIYTMRRPSITVELDSDRGLSIVVHRLANPDIECCCTPSFPGLGGRMRLEHTAGHDATFVVDRESTWAAATTLDAGATLAFTFEPMRPVYASRAHPYMFVALAWTGGFVSRLGSGPVALHTAWYTLCRPPLKAGIDVQAVPFGLRRELAHWTGFWAAVSEVGPRPVAELVGSEDPSEIGEFFPTPSAAAA
jgi:hypothetical protein